MRSIILPLLLLGIAVFAIASCQTYYIVDAKHGRSIVAGDRYDGHIYHQDPRDRPNAKWILEPVHGQPDFFYIKDAKHGQYIVAGYHYDGHLYHQSPGKIFPNAKWRLVRFTDKYGSTYQIWDQKHNRAIVAGDSADNNVYHQYPNSRSNARWALIRN